MLASICVPTSDPTEVRGGSELSLCPIQSQLPYYHLFIFLKHHMSHTQVEPKCDINSPLALQEVDRSKVCLEEIDYASKNNKGFGNQQS